MQIRTKLALQYFLITAGITILSLSYIYIQFKTSLESEFFENLKSKSLMVAEMVASKIDTLEEVSTNEDQTSPTQDVKENVAIFDFKGRKLYSFTPSADILPKEALNFIIKNKEYKYSDGNYKAFGYVYTNKAGIQLAIVSEGIFNHLYLDNLKNILIWVFIISTTLLALGAWYLARLSLAPVTRIMNDMDKLLPTNLDKRLYVKKQKDELSRLIITFNNLLDRIEKAFKTQKMFISNVSHELKNPLNIITSEIEVSLSSPRQNHEYINVLKSVLSETKDLNQVSDKLLQLAKLESEMETLPLSKVRIDDLLWQVASIIQKSKPNYKVKIELLNPPVNENSYVVDCNEPLLKTALMNLAENACKYSNDFTAYITLVLDQEENVRITFRNYGIGIHEVDIKNIFNPFYRSRIWTNIKGSGVGLALVKSILDHQNFSLTVHSRMNDFTEFIVQIPKQKLNNNESNVI